MQPNPETGTMSPLNVLEDVLRPEKANIALTLPQISLRSWVRYRLFGCFEGSGYLVLPDQDGVDLVAYGRDDEVSHFCIQVDGTPLASRTRKMFKHPKAAHLYVVTSPKKKRIFERMARIPPTCLVYSIYHGWLQVPPAYLDLIRPGKT